IKRQLFRCNNDLSGVEIRVEFPGYNPSILTLFQFQRLLSKSTPLLGAQTIRPELFQQGKQQGLWRSNILY
ncbi:MAG: hypothetical protein N2B02_09845, partial [Amylibacter sp.]